MSQLLCITLVSAATSVLSAATYNVGPGQPLTMLRDVQWSAPPHTPSPRHAQGQLDPAPEKAIS